MVQKRQSMMWRSSLLSALMLASFCLANPQNRRGVGCGRYGSYDAENKHIDSEIRAAKPGELPWTIMLMLHAAVDIKGVLYEHNTYLSDGVLINPRVVLVASFRVSGIKQEDLRVRAVGNWAFASKGEEHTTQLRTVDKIINHNTENEIEEIPQHPIAILILSSPLELPRNFPAMCVPRKNDKYDESRCIVGQWSLDYLNPGDYGLLKRIGASIITYDESVIRYEEYKNSRGREIPLSPHVIFAVNEQYPRLFETAAGSPLMCPLINDPSRYVLVGLDISPFRCGSRSTSCLPHQFANVSAARLWIDEEILANGLDFSTYTA